MNLLNGTYLFLCSCFVVLLFSQPAQSKQVLVVGVETDVLRDFNQFVDGRNLAEIEHYGGPFSRRDVIDMLLVQQALLIAGYDLTFEFIAGSYDARNKMLLESGRLPISLDSLWRLDVERLHNVVYVSKPIIEVGQYTAGLYTTPTLAKQLVVRTRADLKKLRTVSSKHWSVDWLTLSQLELKDLYEENEWEAMVHLVKRGWVDFVLAPFQPTDDLSFHSVGVKLVPIPEVRIELKDSRHFVVSKLHPQGKALFAALEIGLTKMKDKGLIERAYRESGLLNQQVSDWTILNQ